MDIAARFKIVRNSLGHSQRELAKKLGSSLGALQSYESGKSVPGGNVLEALARMGFNVNWLLTGEGEIRCYKPDLAGSRVGLDTYSEKFRKIRGNLSISEFAARFGITENQVYALESGEFVPDIHLISSICFHLNISPLWLVEDIGPMTKDEVENRPQEHINPQSMISALFTARTAKKVLRSRGQTMTDEQWISVLIGSYETFVNHEKLINNVSPLSSGETEDD